MKNYQCWHLYQIFSFYCAVVVLKREFGQFPISQYRGNNQYIFKLKRFNSVKYKLNIKISSTFVERGLVQVNLM